MNGCQYNSDMQRHPSSVQNAVLNQIVRAKNTTRADEYAKCKATWGADKEAARGRTDLSLQFIAATLVDSDEIKLGTLASKKNETCKSHDEVNHEQENLDCNSSSDDALDVSLLLCRASQMGRMDVVEACLLRNDINPSYQDATGRNAFHYACAGGHSHIIDRLLKFISKKSAEEKAKLINYADPKGWTPLLIATCNTCPSIVQMLLEHGADPWISISHNSPPSRGITKSSAIHFAAIRKSCVILSLLIDQTGVPVDQLDEAGRTPLHYAAYKKNNDAVVQYLLQKGANPNAIDSNGRTPLHSCVLRGVISTLRLLLEAKADAGIVDVWDLTPLSMARTSDDVELKAYMEAHVGTKVELLSESAVAPLMTVLDRTVADSIVKTLEETKVAQVYRSVYKLGARLALHFFKEAVFLHRTGGMMQISGETRRSAGGIYFTTMKTWLFSDAATRSYFGSCTVEEKRLGAADWKYIVQEDYERLKRGQLERREKRRNGKFISGVSSLQTKIPPL